MWRQDDLFRDLVGAAQPAATASADADAELVAPQVTRPGPGRPARLPADARHRLFTQLIILSIGGCSRARSSARSFDVEELLDTIERERVNQIAIVGDAFAKPMLRALDANPGRWDLASLFLVASSGVMWSEPVKQGLLKHHPGMMLVDAFSSSEAVGMGQSVSSGGSASQTAKFQLGENTIVITDDGRRVEPGSGEIGRVAVGGYQPIGYYKDPEKTAATFIEFEGRRYSCPGDYAMVEADGTLTLLGRGSVVHQHRRREGVPRGGRGGAQDLPGRPRRGGRRRARRQVRRGGHRRGRGRRRRRVRRPGRARSPTCSAKLAAYKAPKHVFVVDTIGRAPNGKVDYKRLKAYAVDAQGS